MGLPVYEEEQRPRSLLVHRIYWFLCTILPRITAERAHRRCADVMRALDDPHCRIASIGELPTPHLDFVETMLCWCLNLPTMPAELEVLAPDQMRASVLLELQRRWHAVNSM